MKHYKIFTILFLLIVLSACSQNNTSKDKIDYEETKKMVIDILKTDDGKKAIQEILSDETVKRELIMDEKTVTDSIEKNLTSDKAKAFWKKAFKDPKFAASYAKSLEDEHKKLLKDLMKARDYLAMNMKTWQDPEMKKELTNVINSKDVRTELKKTTIETIESPLVLEKIQSILLKAAEELPAESKKEKGQGESQSDTSSSGGGGESGGGDQQGGGGS